MNPEPGPTSVDRAPLAWTSIAAIALAALCAGACFVVLWLPMFGGFQTPIVVAGLAAMLVGAGLRPFYRDLLSEWGRKPVTLAGVLDALGPLLGLLLVMALFSLSAEVRPYFFTGANFKIILTQTVVVALGALGMTMIIVSGGIDLSCGSAIALTSVVGAVVLLEGCSPALAAALTILAGGLIGAINGGAIAGLRMMPFIVTLGMMGVARGAAKWLAGNQTVNAPETPINNLMGLVEPTRFFPLPPGVWIALGLAGVMSLLMRQSIFGRYIFAIGSNEATARLCGIRVQWQKLLIYALAGLFFGLAGLMQLSRLTQGDPTAASGLELDIIAAVVIGGASLSGGSGSILGSVIGALIMAVLRNGSSQMGWPNYMQEIIIGVVIIVAVGLDRWRQSRLRSS